MKKKDAILFMKQFVEGDLSAEEMVKLCKFDNEFRGFIKNFSTPMLRAKEKTCLGFIDSANFNIQSNLLCLQLIQHDYLNCLKIKTVPTELYADRSQKEASILPRWLADNAYNWVYENILEKVPNEFNKTQKKKWIKEKIKDVFKYEKRPPSWVQAEEWPVNKNGKFMIFRKQKEDGEAEIYTFVDPDTGKEEIITEYF